MYIHFTHSRHVCHLFFFQTQMPNETSHGSTTTGSMSNNSVRDVTFKPKPIKAQRHVHEHPNMNYQPSHMIAFSPKNPQGLVPFQPTGKQLLYMIKVYR